jgi:hypothetical protein
VRLAGARVEQAQVDFWSIDTAGERPSMKSTSGLSICPRNWRAYAESDST